MFTGIISAMAKVVRATPRDGGLELTVDKPKGFIGAQEGDSVAINGVCLTVKSHNGSLVFDVIPETLDRSNLKDLKKGEMVNVEPSLRVGDFVGGHMVYGHVDATCKIVRKEPEGQGYRLWCSTPRALRTLIIEKGYVSLDGTSLTVAQVKGGEFDVALIPETLKRTTLGRKAVGDSLNIEVDPVARYIAAHMRDRAPRRRKTTRGR
ncbi:MAG TPA: riboflavin synthase [Candidatus Acidoferrales bacterium]|nr:riboflavin synthase [Candidatus Acidoferrales bacterium]